MSENTTSTEPTLPNAMMPEEGRLRILWVVLAVSILVLVVAAWFIIGAFRERAVMESMDDYIKASLSADGPSDTVCAQYRDASVIEGQNVGELGEGFSSDVQSADIDGDNATAKVKFTIPKFDDWTTESSFKMVREDDEWKVCDEKLVNGLRVYLFETYSASNPPSVIPGPTEEAVEATEAAVPDATEAVEATATESAE